MKTQQGKALVELALIALLFFMILLGVMEFARAWFIYNTLVEATRRGARVAAVCPISSAGTLQVKQVTVFDPKTPDGKSKMTGLVGLKTDNVVVSYYNSATPGWISGPLASNESTYNTITFVRVQLSNISNYLILNIPGFHMSFAMPTIQTTLPSQSLGRISYQNPVNTRCCYGFCS